MKKYDAIIVGAGLAGLSCAFELVSKGVKVLLLEAHPYAGGRTASFDDDGMHIESGLHRYIGYYSALPRLLRKCKTSAGDIVTWEDKIDILLKKPKDKIVLGVAPVFGFVKTVRSIFGNRHALSYRDKMSLLPFFIFGMWDYVFHKEKLDSFSVSEYASLHKVTDRAHDYILTPMSSGIFFVSPREYSAFAFFGLFAPAIPKFYKMRAGAFLGGMTEVMCLPIANEVEKKGGEILYNQRVEGVLMEGGAAVGVRTEKGERWMAENVVLAVPISAAKEILAPLKNEESLKDFFALPTMSAVTFQLEMDKPALKKDITSFGPETTLVSFAEQSRSTFRGSDGRLSVVLGEPEKYVGYTAEETLESVLSQAQQLGMDLNGHVLCYRKVNHENDFHTLRKGFQHLRPTQKTRIRGLFLAGDYTKTKYFATMEGAVVSGKKAAKAVRKCSR